MADPVTLVILLAAGEAASPTAAAMAQGARDAFAGVVAEVQESPTVPTDADALAVESQSHPDAVAELIWHDADRRNASLRVHLRQSHRWIERSFRFGPSDPPVERGRTLGFAVASILPELAARPGATGTAPTATAAAPPTAPASPPPGTSRTSTPATSTPTAATAGPSRPATAPTAAAATAGGSATALAGECTPDANTTCPSAQVPAPATASRPPAPLPAPALASGASSRAGSTPDPQVDAPTTHAWEGAPLRDPHLAVDLVAVGATGIGGVANAAGGAGALEWFVHPRLSLRLGGAVRAGELDVAEAHVTTMVASAGLVFLAIRPTRSAPLGAAVRADYLLEHESATHFDSDDPSPVSRGRWVSAVDAFVDGSLLLSSQIGAFMGFGLEDVWAPTYVYVRDVQVAVLPRLRVLVEAGFQLRF
jgi:hypothetical protein